jgi:hypothetical protein
MNAKTMPSPAIRTAATTHPRAAEAIPIPTISGGSQRSGALATVGPKIDPTSADTGKPKNATTATNERLAFEDPMAKPTIETATPRRVPNARS